ncbi:MAG TPA: hypothetical protein VK796_06635 [Cytophaga sp.]|nr:hypothetical protein [Cytophaga sp.]
MLRGYIYAKSGIEDSTAAGGFGVTRNTSKKINDSLNFSECGFFMKIDTCITTVFAEHVNGYRLFIANKSDTVVALVASDGRLNVIAEVYYQNKWQPIEYLLRSWCGNSYHKVYLKQDEYWVCIIPNYDGKLKVKLRYKLILNKGKYIYSNAIQTQINSGQLSKPKGYKSQWFIE